ncbi:MAG: DUF2344 domain-containing protein [Synergistaceae bacterium]|nr:DUF2344 domain-containing protein [Synergistaceae bacterium]
MRVRLIYEKRGRACFVPHVVLSTLFARAAKRAGIELGRTEVFSPHARMSFGPELPAGVVALNEPVDLWLAAGEETTEENRRDFLESVVCAFNAQLPEGFRAVKCILPPEGAPALGKDCKAAHYLAWSGNVSAAELLRHMERHYGEAVLSGFVEQDPFPRVSAVLANPAQNGMGGWVKALIADNVAAGWHDMFIVRTGMGRWNGKQMDLMAG